MGSSQLIPSSVNHTWLKIGEGTYGTRIASAMFRYISGKGLSSTVTTYRAPQAYVWVNMAEIPPLFTTARVSGPPPAGMDKPVARLSPAAAYIQVSPKNKTPFSTRQSVFPLGLDETPYFIQVNVQTPADHEIENIWKGKTDIVGGPVYVTVEMGIYEPPSGGGEHMPFQINTNIGEYVSYAFATESNPLFEVDGLPAGMHLKNNKIAGAPVVSGNFTLLCILADQTEVTGTLVVSPLARKL